MAAATNPAPRSPQAANTDSSNPVLARISGLSALKGAVLYGAILTFVGFYAYFIAKIFAAAAGKPPSFDATMVSAAAALAGVLGSAFALVIGVPTNPTSTNEDLKKAIDALAGSGEGARPSTVVVTLRKIFSLEPSDEHKASWPLTIGIWAYAVVGSAVAVTYFLNQNETPDAIKTLALAFGGYVIALVTAAYGIGSSGK